MVKLQQRNSPAPRSLIGTVADPETWRRLPRLRTAVNADLLEFRADSIPSLLDSSKGVSVQSPLPVLLTVRRLDEGGGAPLTDRDRAACYERLLPLASLIDIEIRSFSALASTRALAQSAGLLVVASFHDFSGTPSRSRLRALILRAEQAGAGIVKVATQTRCAADVATLAGLLERPVSPVPLAVMGMGPVGAGSRVLLAQLGSVLNYGYLLHPNAPGQWPVSLLRQIVSALPPFSPPQFPPAREGPAAKP